MYTRLYVCMCVRACVRVSVYEIRPPLPPLDGPLKPLNLPLSRDA